MIEEIERERKEGGTGVFDGVEIVGRGVGINRRTFPLLSLLTESTTMEFLMANRNLSIH